MRQRIASPILRYFVLAIALVLAAGTPALADDRADARTHYQAGVKFYNGGDYRSAIREFSAAQQLVPADLNNYNLALCYDKLGDPEPAIQYYRQYLDKVPSTDKRAEIEASVARLDAAAKSVAAKKAEEARRVEEARIAEENRKAEEARKAEDARRAEEARLAAEAKRNPPIETDTNLGSRPVASGGSTGTPATGVVSTGDASLDRVSSIDVNGIRDQRQISDPYAPQQQGQQGQQQMTAGAANAGAGAPPQQGAQQGQQGQPNGQQGQLTALDEPVAKPVPVYKKWWFWAVVAVSAYVVYQIANDDSSPSSARAKEVLPLGPAPQPNAGGMTLLRW
jgi:tetratricopeptide (TPR) repeat protein